MTRRIAIGLGVAGLVAYAALRIAQGRPALPSILGAALGIVVLGLLARGR